LREIRQQKPRQQQKNYQTNISLTSMIRKTKKKIKHWEPLDCRECIKPNKFNAFLEKNKNTKKKLKNI